MKLPTRLDVERLLPARVPFGLRVFFRGAFLLLGLATIALAIAVLQDEKERSYRNYQDGFRKNQAQIAAKLRHPTGQLVLLNPTAYEHEVTPLRPLVLPFSALDFDDRNKAQQAVEMAGCLVQYPDAASMCVAVGNNPFAGGFIYAVGSFNSGPLVSHTSGTLDLSLAHRARITVDMRGQRYRWIAPFQAMQAMDEGRNASLFANARGRLVGFVDEGPITPASRPVRDFRGWLWQDSRCMDGTLAADPECARRAFVSVRLPVELFREALFSKGPAGIVWPPADLDQIKVQVEMLAPGEGKPLFDSNAEGATAPFSWAELTPLLLLGEKLRIRKLGAAGASTDIVALSGAEATERSSPLIAWLIRRLQVDGYDAPITSAEVISTPLGRYELILTGDIRTVNKALTVVATRVSWFVGGMLLAIFVTWLAIELRIIHRITVLTRRAASVSKGVRASDSLATVDLTDLRGGDELGVLAGGLQDLLQRVNEDVRREQIRIAQEKDTWHAVGHEIMSPLQSLMVLHGSADDPAHRYISRMQQAVRVLYGSASPSEAFESTALNVQTLDANEFLSHVARNAAAAGIPGVAFEPLAQPVRVRADEYSLEDVVSHVLRNADRYRLPGSLIRITMSQQAQEGTAPEAVITISNQGPQIEAGLLDKIFEYGVSDQPDSGTAGQRGQGLFVAKTYMAKMGGTITAHNRDSGVCLELRLQCAA
ncbi:ATP-binding protein [Polaromonas aquatica]|uniref:sensor histidine kinase n=1 Tax=Polaromonas aquatica TaxID=332657 RepID=UPI003D64654D